MLTTFDKKYTVKVTMLDGTEEIVSFLTSNIAKSIQDYSQRKPVLKTEVLKEENLNSKQLLLG